MSDIAPAQPKLGPDGRQLAGPNGRPMRQLLKPASFRGGLRLWRYLILRRLTQFGVLLLFFGTFHWGWSVAGQPLLNGNLSGAEFLGLVPLADPFAVLQMFVAQHLLDTKVIIGAVLILVLYGALAGRAFCSWVCPLNIVTDLANWLRRKLDLTDVFHLPRSTRYLVLGLALLLSAVAGVAAFEWVSPISMLHRELIFGIGLGWMAVLGVFVLDLFVIKNGWCGHFCPLGAFYSLVSRRAQLKVRFDHRTCTHCAECATVCPEPQVLNLRKAAAAGMVGFECTNCGRCTPVCPEGSLSFDLRYRIPKPEQAEFIQDSSMMRRTA